MPRFRVGDHVQYVGATADAPVGRVVDVYYQEECLDTIYIVEWPPSPLRPDLPARRFSYSRREMPRLMKRVQVMATD